MKPTKPQLVERQTLFAVTIVLGTLLALVIVQAVLPDQIRIGNTVFFDDFSNNSAGEFVMTAEHALTDWTTGGTRCTYAGDSLANCTNAEIETEVFSHTATATSRTSCFSTNVGTTATCRTKLRSKHTGIDKCITQIQQGNFTVTVNGAVNITSFPVANFTNYTIYAQHNSTALQCDYLIINQQDASDNLSLPNFNESQLISNVTDFFTNIQLTGTSATGSGLFDYIYIYNGTIAEDPGVRFVNFSVFSPQSGQWFDTKDTTVLFSGNITPNDDVNLVNLTYNFTQNLTPVEVCTNCVNWSIDFPNLDINGRYDLNLMFQSGNITENTNLTLFKGIVLENCSLHSTSTALNFTFRDESSEAILPDIDEVDIQVVGWNTTASDNVTLANEEELVNNLDVCVFHNNTITANYFIESTESTYATRRFTRQRQTLTRFVQNIDIFLLLSSSATSITFTVVDGRQQPLQGLLLEAYRARIDNTFDLVAALVTDLKGEAQFNLDQDREYQFIVKRLDGTVLKTVEKFKPIQTTYTIQVDLDPKIILKTLLDTNQVANNLSFDNNTGFVTANWTAATGLINFGCLRIENRTILGNFGLVNVSCLSGDAGEIQFNTSAFNNSLLIGTLFVNAQRDLRNYTLAQITIDLIQKDYVRWGITGLFVVIFIFFTVIAAIALNNAFLVVLSGMAGTFLIFFTGMTALTMTAMIGIISIGGLILYFIRNT